MKKIIGLALALAAAALVFVGCSDSTDNAEGSGSKWNRTIKVKDETEAALNPTDAKYRRAWMQLGDNEKTAGIITTITIKKEGLVSEIKNSNNETTNWNSGVVGFMFDYNNHIDADGNEDKNKRDFGLIGLSLGRGTSSKSGYYVVKNVGVEYKDNLDTSDDDLVKSTTTAKGQVLTNEKTDSLDRDDYLSDKHVAWVNVDKSALYKEVHWDDKSTYNDAYQVVIRISPTITNEALDGEGYDIFIGPDKDSVCNPTSAKSVATYKPEAAHKVAGHKLEVEVNGEKKDIPCGGVAMYLNAKTSNFSTGNKFTKIEARYTTERTTRNNNNKFDSITELQNASVVGDLKIANTSDGNITVIVE